MTAEFAAVLVTLFVAHKVGDMWVQTDWQAATKGRPGRVGRVACLLHVFSYTLTALVFMTVMSTVTGWYPGELQLMAGMAVSAVTHYVADRRAPLVWLARLVGHGTFVQLGAPRPGRDDNPSLGTGAYALDQSWHYLWLFVSALIIAT